MDTTTPEPRLSSEELLGSLTGYDEDELETGFGKPLDVLVSGSNTMLFRGLIFVELRRQGMKAPEARKVAMSKTAEETLARFADDEVEPSPESPVTESGKEPSEPE